MFVGREFASLAELPSATVCNVPESLDVLWRSEASWSEFERLAGYIVAGRYIDYPRSTRYNRAAELRAHGIFIDPMAEERLEVPVGRHLQTLAAAWAA
jgi:hypothetical protein